MTVGRNLTQPARILDGEELEGGLKEPTFEEIEIPEDFGPVELCVDDLKVKRFAFVADDFGDWYLRASPWGPRIGQPGLLANDLLQLFTKRYAASRVVGLHTTEELWFQHPVFLGQRVQLAGQYVEKYERRGQGYVVMEADARDSDGTVLVRHRGVEIMRTRPGAVAGRGGAGGSDKPRVTGDYDATLPLVEQLGAGVRPGMGLVPIAKEITVEQMAVFSRIGEFVRNIHNDLARARDAGLQVPILQGQHQICHLAQLCARCFGARWFTDGWLKAKFLRPINAFDNIEIAGAVHEVTRDGAMLSIELELWVRSADGDLSTIGWARGLADCDRNGRAVLTPDGNLMRASADAGSC